MLRRIKAGAYNLTPMRGAGGTTRFNVGELRRVLKGAN